VGLCVLVRCDGGGGNDFMLMRGFIFDIFGVLCFRGAIVGVMEGLLGLPRAVTR
jgi:hypothetical protein